jgi:hypothetical protein
LLRTRQGLLMRRAGMGGAGLQARMRSHAVQKLPMGVCG